MRVLVSGSTGLIGSMLVSVLESTGHEVVRLLRSQQGGSGQGIMWNPATGTLDRHALEGFDAVVHLAGENIANRRWTARQMGRIRDSRVDGTSLLAGALATLDSPPAILACASAGGYYGDRGDELLKEDSPQGTGFMAAVTREWEEAAAPAADAGIRVVNLRIGVVMTAAGGMLARILPIFRLGLGGRLGPGDQYMSWLTRSDAVRAIIWTLTRDHLSGPINVSSPSPITNAEFTGALATVLRRPALLTVPRLALRIVQGDLSEVVLSSARMEPARLIADGFEFSHPEIHIALRWALEDTAR